MNDGKRIKAHSPSALPNALLNCLVIWMVLLTLFLGFTAVLGAVELGTETISPVAHPIVPGPSV